MKKLMIALAIAGLAVASQAAAVDWMIMPNELMPGVEGGTFTGEALITCVETGWSTTVDVSGGDFMYMDVIETDMDAAYNFTMTASVNVGGTDWTYEATGFGTTDNFGSGMAGIDAGTWSAVPEPTSGLLMLLGVAGLALKRKRA